MPKRILITGGAGFIGSHLVERLLKDGHAVTVLDDVSTGRIQNIRHLLEKPDFQFVRDSVENEWTVNTLVSSCDAVFHLASAVGVQLIVDEPVRTIRTTIHGTEVVLEAAFKFGRPVLITSSSEVYGKGAREPLQVYGDGSQTRCFCHVSDVADAMVRLTQDRACVGQVYNLGSDEEISIE